MMVADAAVAETAEDMDVAMVEEMMGEGDVPVAAMAQGTHDPILRITHRHIILLTILQPTHLITPRLILPLIRHTMTSSLAL